MKLLIKPLVFISGLAIFACNNSNSGSSTSDSAASKMDSTKTDSAVSQNKPNREQEFVDYAVPGNTKEIIWLEAGIKNGQNKELRDHAKMMLKDHKKLDETVKKYLSNHSGLAAPSVDTSNVVNLTAKKGMEWDKAWADKMVDDHGDLLGKLKQSQTEVSDTALLSIINSTIPVVESHLAMAKGLQGKLH